jgi:glycogen debranching enzyme
MNETPVKIDGSKLRNHGDRSDGRPILKCGDVFAVFGTAGDFFSELTDEEGLYFDGTRFLSKKLLLLNGAPLSRLRTEVRTDGEELRVVSGNCEGSIAGIQEYALSVAERIFLVGESMYSEVSVTNFGRLPAEVTLSIHFEADYADIYEVRGMKREAHGVLWDAITGKDHVVLTYEGLDCEIRKTILSFVPMPSDIQSTSTEFQFHLLPGGTSRFQMIVTCERSGRKPSSFQSYAEAHESLGHSLETSRLSSCSILSSNAQFNGWWNRSVWDLQLLTTSVATGKYPYAGVPWFNTPFGRDGLITGLETLWMAPELSRGVLAFLASTQAKECDPDQDAEPGKILHETRSGEMAARREMPFGRYYGSVDAPPLFVVLAEAYLRRSGDLVFTRQIWDSVVAALRWMSVYGDRDGDGFLEYERHSSGGLIHQSWKDSDEAIFHEDGTDAQGALAVCEVQGYAYAAFVAGAQLATIFGHKELAEEWASKADRLKNRFNATFWCEKLGTYGIALDGSKKLCCVAASNAGQLLFSGIVPVENMASVAASLMSSDFFSGWGVRTLSRNCVKFNPTSYHNGSVWPHDNAIIAFGLSKCGLKMESNTIFEGIFDVATRIELQRLPELLCGFPREAGYGPTPYPVACSPQAWAAGAASLLLQGALGMDVNCLSGCITFDHPCLPSFLSEVHIQRLPVLGSHIDLIVRRCDQSTSIAVENNQSGIQVVVRS